MTTTTHEMATEIRKNRDALLALRDEIRLKIHLAGMDAKDAWAELEPAVLDIERAASEVSESTRRASREVLARVRALRARLERGSDHQPTSGR
jgi:hypothetical protein